MHKLFITKPNSEAPEITVLCQHDADMSVFTGTTMVELLTFLHLHGANG